GACDARSCLQQAALHHAVSALHTLINTLALLEQTIGQNIWAQMAGDPLKTAALIERIIFKATTKTAGSLIKTATWQRKQLIKRRQRTNKRTKTLAIVIHLAADRRL